MKEIYLDNSATTPLSAAARKAFEDAFDVFANPSSLHAAGMRAADLLETARATLLDAAGAGKDYGLVFCGSGSEANNLAVLGALRTGKHFPSGKVIISDSEHPSVDLCASRAAEEGFEVARIPTAGGRLDTKALERELAGGAALVSVMLVNNETGAIYDLEAVGEITRRLSPGTLVHCDAVQGFMRVPLPLASVDLISVSAHKIGGPKGCGALLVRREVLTRKALSPVIRGGGQESGLRSGTENTPAAAAFAEAAGDYLRNRDAYLNRLSEVGAYARKTLERGGCRINTPEKGVPYIISLTLPGIKSQVMLNFLSERGICVSSGSACSSKDRRVSRALKAFGLSDPEADCTIRISLSPANTKEEIDALASALDEGCAKLVRIKR